MRTQSTVNMPPQIHEAKPRPQSEDKLMWTLLPSTCLSFGFLVLQSLLFAWLHDQNVLGDDCEPDVSFWNTENLFALFEGRPHSGGDIKYKMFGIAI